MRIALVILMLGLSSAPGGALGDSLRDLARQGWVYRLRTTMIGRDMSIPVQIHARNHLGATLCVVGEAPDAASRTILDAFRTLVAATFAEPLPYAFAGEDIATCPGPGRIVLRLYSGSSPNRELTADLRWLDRAYALGLPAGRDFALMSPAQGQTFFGRRGMATHLVVQQARDGDPPGIARRFHASILIEELYQAFTFGMDILHFDPDTPFRSKLEEAPWFERGGGWHSPAFMERMIASSPAGLCRFDMMLLLALAHAPVVESTDPRLLDYLDAHREALWGAAGRLFTDPRFAPLVDPACV